MEDIHVQGNPNFYNTMSYPDAWGKGYYKEYNSDEDILDYYDDEKMYDNLKYIDEYLKKEDKVALILGHLIDMNQPNQVRLKHNKLIKDSIDKLNSKNILFFDNSYLVKKYGFRILDDGFTDIHHLPWIGLEEQMIDMEYQINQLLKKEDGKKSNSVSGSIDIVKNHLSYRLGKLLVENKSLFSMGTLSLPKKMKKEISLYKSNKPKYKNHKPLDSYSDYKGALAIKDTLSYKIGNRILNSKTIFAILSLPFSLVKIKNNHDILKSIQSKLDMNNQIADLNKNISSFKDEFKYENKKGEIGEMDIKNYLSRLENKIDKLQDSISTNNESYIKELESSKLYMTEKIFNSTTQLEKFMNLQNYFIHNYLPLEFHGWPLSPDISLELVNEIHNNDYDLIIEFGSGTSTILFSQIVKNNNTKTKILTFEHQEFYFNKTRNELESRGLLKNVDIKLAPLVEEEYSGSQYKYYDLKKYLKEYKKTNFPGNKKIKILMLVDGPPANTGKYARYPALLSVLKDFKGSSINLYLDDYNRLEEQEVANLWREDMDKEGLLYESDIIKTEKGLWKCQLS